MNKVLTVSQLNNYVKNVFDDELILQNITVEGEVSEIKYTVGNTYLTLKEGECVLPCVKFGSRFEFEIGDKIRVIGGVRFYPKGGKITFVVVNASAVGKGDLLAKFNDLKQRLAKEGVFDNKKSMPQFVQRLALVTSVEGAVIHDFLETLNRNSCGYIDVDVYGVKVQGGGAEQTIAQALKKTNLKEYDIVVVARGGGSEQDLGCFNTEITARSVFDCVHPIISAVGHEVDYTLCDFASSIRAGTPSIAAELIVRNNESFLQRFTANLLQLKNGVENLVSKVGLKAKSVSSDLAFECSRKFSEFKNQIDKCARKMGDAVDKCVCKAEDNCEQSVKSLYESVNKKSETVERDLNLVAASLDKTSPLKILSCGYAKVIKDGTQVSNATEVNVGDRVKVILSGGSFGATVTAKERI